MDSDSDISALAWSAGWFGSLVRQQRSLSVFRFAPRKIRLAAAAGAEEEGGHAAGRQGEVGARLFSTTHAQ